MGRKWLQIAYLKAGQLKKFLSNVSDNSYIAVGTRENNEIDEIKQESGIIDINLKTIGFDSGSSNDSYVKIYTKKYEESGCLRFVR